MVENNKLQAFEKAPALIARDLMASRFPDLENRKREAFRHSSSFRDLCEDYHLLVTRQAGFSNEQMDSINSTAAILHSLKLELEQEMFDYLKISNR